MKMALQHRRTPPKTRVPQSSNSSSSRSSTNSINSMLQENIIPLQQQTRTNVTGSDHAMSHDIKQSHPTRTTTSFVFSSQYHRIFFICAISTLLYIATISLFSSSMISMRRPQTMFPHQPDVIVVGSGLAGLAATLTVLDRGGNVWIIEKEHVVGGNSNKASSGINACCTNQNNNNHDTMDLFQQDTMRSGGTIAQSDLIDVLVQNSAAAVQWLEERVLVDLSIIAQLGGSSVPRTHRPVEGMVGAEIIFALQRTLQPFLQNQQLTLYTDTTVTQLLHITNPNTGDVVVTGIEYRTLDGTIHQQHSPNVVLATGGFASDKSSESLLRQHRPDLINFTTTAGAFSTGDGITLAEAVNADTRDMSYVQLHPTGFVDPNDPNNPTKVLAAELTRGVGGILLNNDTGKRFCNELGLRNYVTEQMLRLADENYVDRWDPHVPVPVYTMVLASAAAEQARKHVDYYTQKGLLTRLVGIQALADWMKISESILIETFHDYVEVDAVRGQDSFGKTTFRGLPNLDNLQQEVFYVGSVTPVLHYCMGGLKVDAEGSVLRRDNGTVIAGLHAIGEVAGGVHGANRMGGNSLLECTVFGRVVGGKISISPSIPRDDVVAPTKQISSKTSETHRSVALPIIPRDELAQHHTKDDCWVAVRGKVYDLTKFALEHPAGKAPIYKFAGADATETFDILHNGRILEQFKLLIVGQLEH